ncbi:MAG: hypothetical protein RJA10_2737, partial [Pseudomonadota bacterium]
AWQTQRLADGHAQQSRLAAAARHHTTLPDRLGRLSAWIGLHPEAAAETAARMAAELAASRDEALQLQQLAARTAPEGGTGTDSAVQGWETARERLWSRAESLLAHVAAGHTEAYAESIAAVQRESNLAAQAAQDLAARWLAQSRQQQADDVRAARVGAGITAALWLGLGLGVVAPALRALQGQARRLAHQARESERLAQVAEHTGNLVVITDRERRLVWANEAFTRLTGYELHEVLGRSPGQLLQSDRTDPATVARVREALDAGSPIRVELSNRSRDGRDYWVDADIQPLRDHRGELTGFIAVETVITEQVAQRLRADALLDVLPTAVVVYGQQGTVLQANQAAQALIGARPGDASDALMSRRPLDDDLELLVPAELPAQRALNVGQGERGQLLGVDDGDGGRRWLLASTEPLRDAGGQPDGAVACFVDMTERRRLLDQMRDSARTDPLTRMPNRSAVLERVQHAIDHRRRHPEYGFAVLFLDVDRFKQVNDTLGHSAGDELLRQVAGRLHEALRPGDAVARAGSDVCTAARIGGDEFVIVLEGIRQPDDAGHVADRLLSDLSKPYRLGSNPVQVSVSIGIVGAAQASDDAGTVLRDGDTAMYEAKRAGRGRWMLFDPTMRERVRSALELEGELRRALARDELSVVYQPVVDLANDELLGVEALPRWHHPVQGEIPPGQFIELAEECGLSDAIGELVLQKACAQFALWQQHWGERAPRLLTVNLSRAQLKQPGLVPEVVAVLQDSGVRPEQLQLEVTERFAAQDAQVQAMLGSLKRTGIRLALDDFGTGYLSLSCLHQLPVDTVKIDRSFVGHAHDVEYQRVLIQATTRVAKTLGMTTVAEGIETRDQADLMAQLQCDRGQGSLYGRPMSAPDLDRWIERQATGTVV